MSGPDDRKRPEESSASRGWAGAVFNVPPAGLHGRYPKWRGFVLYGVLLIVLVVLAAILVPLVG